MKRNLNPNIKKKKKTLKTSEEYFHAISTGDRFALSDVLTLIESSNKDQRKIGDEVLSKLGNSSSSTALRIGITGSPGAGKSTFIEALGSKFLSEGKKVAVLAVDPSSTISQGSILGDKTRMSELASHPNAFVRPTASSNELGGVVKTTKESIALCEAGGYDIILVESVGVGQSETDLANLVDIYLLLLLPGGGDDVQGIKRGVVELADIMIINKNDGERKTIAKESQRAYKNASQLFFHELKDWKVPVLLCSSLENTGLEKISESILAFTKSSKEFGLFYRKRKLQDSKWIHDQIEMRILELAKKTFNFSQLLANINDSKQNIFQTLSSIDFSDQGMK